MVDQPNCQTNRMLLLDILAVSLQTRPRSSNKIPNKYLESELSAQQLADEFWVSKQFVLTQLRAAGIRKSGLRGRSPENYRFHNPPYGFRVREGRLEPDQREMKVARLIVELRDRQGESFAKVAAELNQRGWKNRRGTEWNVAAIRRVHKRWAGKI